MVDELEFVSTFGADRLPPLPPADPRDCRPTRAAAPGDPASAVARGGVRGGVQQHLAHTLVRDDEHPVWAYLLARLANRWLQAIVRQLQHNATVAPAVCGEERVDRLRRCKTLPSDMKMPADTILDFLNVIRSHKQDTTKTTTRYKRAS